MALVINIILVDSAVLEIKNSVARGSIKLQGQLY